ncbi:hypothetical protein J2P12_05075, partial [Candidatus Bathyarchaeota archaeon]|nr:hypothetical protein [Candidatus Bathyarchaeota archaeon]
LGKVEQLLVSEEEMQRLYQDARPIRRYCLQCRGPKYMVPSKRSPVYHDSMAQPKTPEKYSIVCKTCGTKYTAKLNSR